MALTRDWSRRLHEGRADFGDTLKRMAGPLARALLRGRAGWISVSGSVAQRAIRPMEAMAMAGHWAEFDMALAHSGPGDVRPLDPRNPHPVFFLAADGQDEIVERLVALDPCCARSTDADGLSAADWADRSGHRACARFLRGQAWAAPLPADRSGPAPRGVGPSGLEPETLPL